MGALQYKKEATERGKDSLSFYFLPCEREPLSWKEELFAAARSIVNRTNKPIWVCSSGGIDSEIACRSFYDQGINFSVLTVEHEAGTNYHDIKFAIEWCRERGVQHKIVKLDMPRFLSHDVEEYAKKYPAFHPFRYFQIRLMEIVEEMGGFAVLAGGEQLYQTDRTKQLLTKDDVTLMFTTGNIAPLEWLKDTKLDHEPYFYFSQPEVCAAYMRIPLVEFAINNPEAVFRHKANTFTLKRLVYQSVWTDLEVRYKADGFEKIKKLVNDSADQLKQRFQADFVIHHMPVTVFESQLYAKLRAH